MFSKLLNHARKNFVISLTLWYTIIFVISFVILFVVSYFIISESIKHNDREDISIESNELELKYNEGGINALKKELDFEILVSGDNLYFVRVANNLNETVYLNIPDKSSKTDFDEINSIAIITNNQWIELFGNDDSHHWEILSMLLDDGRTLQVGKSTELRLGFLNKFRGIIAWVVVIMIVIGFTGGAIIAKRAIRPVRSLIKELMPKFEAITHEAHVPVKDPGNEFEELAAMFKSIQNKNELLINELRSALDNIAHDVRTPVTRLRGLAELALDSESGNDTLREALNKCIEESELITTILNTLIGITAVESGVMKLEVEKSNLTELIGQVVELYDFVAGEKNIIISVKMPDVLTANVDGNKMRQVLANIVDNAIKYTPDGGKIEIEAYGVKDEVIVNIKDSGIGIPSEEIPRIWDRLYRGDKSRSQKGLGLGLSIVQAIIKAHKGYIEVISQPGNGSLFSIHIPQYR
ncbi:MAG: sensor histidine kinase [Thermodesulfobacteriota bacterium]